MPRQNVLVPLHFCSCKVWTCSSRQRRETVAALDTSGGQAPSPHGAFCQLGGNTSCEDFLDPFASSPLQKGMRRGMLVSDFCSKHWMQAKLGYLATWKVRCGRMTLKELAQKSRANFVPLSHCFCRNLNIPQAVNSSGEDHAPNVHWANSWDFSARFPGKNVVNDGWVPWLIQNEQNHWSPQSLSP